jgi:hypothetical protein
VGSSTTLPMCVGGIERTHTESPKSAQIHPGEGFQSPTWTERLTYDFLRVSRASKVFLVPINMPLNL